MALQTLSLAPTNGTAAQFRAWGSAISAAIATNGMVLTADTGQINWTTVAAPSAANTSQGYEIWRFNDTAQTAAPIYLKLEYGGANPPANPQMWLTVGTGSDGAGTITGTFFSSILSANVLVPRTQLAGTTGLIAGSSATTSNTYVNGDAAALAIWFWPSFAAASSTGTLLLVERSRAYDGTATTDGYIAVAASCSAGVTGTIQMYPVSYLANNYTLASGTVGAFAPGGANGGGSTHNIGGTLYPQPLFTHYNAKIGGPSQYILGSQMGDLGGGATLSLSHYGTARTWMHAGLGGSGWGAWQGSAKSFLFRMN